MAEPRKSYALWLTGHILRFLFTLLIFAVCALLIWRVFISGSLPKEMKQLAPNAPLAEAYRTHGDALTLYTQEQNTLTRADSNYGYFGVPRCVFIPQAQQIQVVFRYNNSTLEHVQADFSLAEAPPRGVEIFDVTVVKVLDTTPEDKSDNTDDSPNLKKERIAPTDRRITTTLLYTYCLYTFDGAEMTPDTVAAFLDVYYGETVDYNAAAYGTLRLYHCESENLPATLSGKEEKALQAFAQ